jgi:opacity protein-like surface antigen
MKHPMLGTVVGAAIGLIPAMAAAAPVNQWSGIYVGAQAGYAMGASREYYPTTPDVTQWRAQSEGGGAGVFAGYNLVINGAWLAGLEVEATRESLGAHYYDSYYGGLYYAHTWSVAGRARLGAFTSPDTLLYASLGVATGDLDYGTGYWGYEGYEGLNHTVAGVQFGAGIETFVNPNLSLRAEGIFTAYRGASISYADSVYYKADFDVLAARVGIAYHPGWLGQPASDVARPPVTRSWAGLYAGIHAGMTTLGSVEDYDPNSAYTPYNPSYGLGAPAASGGALVGFNWQSGSYLLGIEADGSLRDSAIPSTIYVRARNTWEAAVRARVGFVTGGNTLLYGTVGLAVGDFDYSKYWNPPSYSGSKFIASGLQLGVGAETFLSQRISARVDGLYTDYGEHQILQSGSPYWIVRPRTLEARVGLTYHLK